MWDAHKKVEWEYKSFPLHNKNGPHNYKTNIFSHKIFQKLAF